MQLNLTTKFSIIIGGVLVLAVISTALATVTARQVAGLMLRAATENVPSVRAGEEVEIALLGQHYALALFTFGRAASEHLRDIRRAEEDFRKWHEEARRTAHAAEERRLLQQLDEFYSQYGLVRDRVVSLREAGNQEQAESLVLGDLKGLYGQAYDVCEKLIAANEHYVASATTDAVAHTQAMTWIVGGCVAATLLFGAALVWYFVAAIVLPLRRMISEAGGITGQSHLLVDRPGDELKAIGDSFRGLMADVVESRSAVEDSRRRLLISEKLASVGRLAASVAHEIRNPLTAVKMLLFSIRKSVEDNPQIDRKLDTVTEEIRRLESIIRNFLEFSRPPSLKLQRQSPLDTLEKTLQLFQTRLAKQRIDLMRKDAECVPEIMADSEQLRQVLINLLENAAEATGEGGRIGIFTAVEADADGHRLAVIRIEDTGHGIPEDIRQRLFEPFFTTKNEGTGLGLCIAAQIVAAHHGRLVLESSTPGGTRFAVCIPAAGGACDE